MRKRVWAAPAAALVAMALAGCGGDESKDAATTAAVAAKATSFGVELPRTGDYGLHDGLASFIPEGARTRGSTRPAG